MATSTTNGLDSPLLSRGVVLRVHEDTCEIFAGGQVRSVGYAPAFPSPRSERVSPGHLVAVAARPTGSVTMIWRWYDAVVLGLESSQVRLWEPAHGEVIAQPRQLQAPPLPGSRAYLSAGLPGADWWVAGAVAATPEDAEVELDEVERFYREHDLWSTLA